MPVSALILSGGRAMRMGGINKGMALLHQQPLIEHVVARIAPQTDEILINANRELELYARFGKTILADEHPDYIGPLAGIYVGLKHAKFPLLLTVPCDSPLLPHDLVARLLQALTHHHAEIAVAASEGHSHPVIGLYKTSVLPSLSAFIAKSERKVSKWQQQQKYTEVDFSDAAASFVNLNTLDDLRTLEKLTQTNS